MTRLQTMASIIAAPFLALTGKSERRAAYARSEDDFVMFLPGTYTIAPGGCIRVVGARHIDIKGCTMQPDREKAV